MINVTLSGDLAFIVPQFDGIGREHDRQGRQRTGKHAVECFHCTKKPRVMRDPRLGGAGWNCHADSKTLLQHKPGSKGRIKCRTAMVDDGKFTLCKPRRYWAALAASQRLSGRL
jgi:hypothetical protein